jgi:hypothetical protein
MILIIFAIGMIAFWGLSRYIYQRACLRREKQWPDLETIDNCGNQILKEASVAFILSTIKEDF